MSFRRATVSPAHYAHNWKVASRDDLHDRDKVNALGVQYAKMPAGPEKEAILLGILECFHGYLVKYLGMVTTGHLPEMNSPAGKDSVAFLKTLVPQGRKGEVNRLVLMSTCRTLHLAFKQMSSDDIYDTLVLCLIRAVDKYDPTYTDKIQQVCQVVDKLPTRRRPKNTSEFTVEDINSTVGFDAYSYIRWLVRKGLLASVYGPKKNVVGYQRGVEWPPLPSMFQSGPVGLVYFIQKYFRWYLHEYISGAMSSIEVKEGMLQLDHRSPGGGAHDGFAGDIAIPHADGAFVDAYGYSYAADVDLLNLSLDLSMMTLEWIQKTNDRLFRKLTIRERHILYLVFVRECKWSEISELLDVKPSEAKRTYDRVMRYLTARADAKRKTAALKSAIAVSADQSTQ